MIQTAEEVVENVRALPMSEKLKFFELLEVEKNRKSKTEIKLKLEQPRELSKPLDTN